LRSTAEQARFIVSSEILKKPLEHPAGLPGNGNCQFLNLTFKEREFFLHARPEQVPVYPEIPVGNDIPHTCYPPPVTIGRGTGKRIRNMFRCFTNNLDIPEDRILRLVHPASVVQS
jgi:hypothetical protein